MQKQKKIKNEHKKSIFCVFLALIFCILSIPFVFNFQTASATDVYSDVIEDLQKDETFSVDNYPVVAEKYSLDVITIAESEDKELFVYVYQPAGKLQATSINISQSINESFSPKNYSLSLLSQNGTLSKYLVKDFNVLSDSLRYYSIVSIFRAWNEDLGDEKPSGDNTISEVSYEVGKLFTLSTVDGVISYTCEKMDTIRIVDKYLGFIRYSNGFTLYHQSCDSHYVAFSTDYNIDKLMNASVTFYYQDVTYKLNLTGSHRYSESTPISKTVELSEIDTGSNSAHGWFADSYEWQRIESVSDFIANEDLTEDTKTELKDKEWVLRFYESDYQLTWTSSVSWEKVQEVTDVTILELTFEVNGQVYNLGVVDNKQSGGLLPDNDMPDWLNTLIEWLIRIVLTLVALVLIVLFFPYIVIILWFILKYICLGIYWLFAWPFYLFKKK